MCRSRLIKKLDKFEITVIMTSYMKELLSVGYERRKLEILINTIFYSVTYKPFLLMLCLTYLIYLFFIRVSHGMSMHSMIYLPCYHM